MYYQGDCSRKLFRENLHNMAGKQPIATYVATPPPSFFVIGLNFLESGSVYFLYIEKMYRAGYRN